MPHILSKKRKAPKVSPIASKAQKLCQPCPQQSAWQKRESPAMWFWWHEQGKLIQENATLTRQVFFQSQRVQWTELELPSYQHCSHPVWILQIKMDSWSAAVMTHTRSTSYAPCYHASCVYKAIMMWSKNKLSIQKNSISLIVISYSSFDKAIYSVLQQHLEQSTAILEASVELCWAATVGAPWKRFEKVGGPRP